jgi:transglutaminase-like putative cysteine protease
MVSVVPLVRLQANEGNRKSCAVSDQNTKFADIGIAPRDVSRYKGKYLKRGLLVRTPPSSVRFAAEPKAVVRRAILILFFFLPSPFLALAQWQQPTPEELKMTSVPAAPDADAVYLSVDEATDDNMHTKTVYVRLKILTDQGKKYADVEVPYEGRNYSVDGVEGRTIHSDGTVQPFTGKPFDRLAEKTSEYKYVTKVFSMPDVQPGSIIEYRYSLHYHDSFVIGGVWYVQRDLYVAKAHFSFAPFKDIERVDTKGGFAGIQYVHVLPSGLDVKKDVTGRFSLDATDIPAAPAEEYLPPIRSLTYRVLFYYTGYNSADDFWKGRGHDWSKDMDKFASPSGRLADAARELVSGANTPDEKLGKLYDAVMKMENTNFTRERSAEENNAQGVKHIESAQDVFDLKRGDSDQLALLFIALARAAGFKAYAMQVTNRDENLFQQYYLTLRQLDDVIAIVEVNGKDVYFDPGQRYCKYGSLHWKHTMSTGLRQTDHGAVIATTPNGNYKDTQIQRSAYLTIDASGKVTGLVRILMSGTTALRWRQRALETDEIEASREFENDLQRSVPDGVVVKARKMSGLDDYQHLLMVTLDVSGSMGTATPKRVFLPCFFFEAGEKPLFPHAKRVNPVDLHYPYVSQDDVTIILPPGEKLEQAPQNSSIPLQQFALYSTAVTTDGSKLSLNRTLVMANTIYYKDEYPALKGFLDKVNSDDQERAIVERSSQSGAGQ